MIERKLSVISGRWVNLVFIIIFVMVMLLSLRVSLCLTFRHRKGLITGEMLGLYWARMFLLNTCNKLKIFSDTLGSTNNALSVSRYNFYTENKQ